MILKLSEYKKHIITQFAPPSTLEIVNVNENFVAQQGKIYQVNPNAEQNVI